MAPLQRPWRCCGVAHSNLSFRPHISKEDLDKYKETNLNPYICLGGLLHTIPSPHTHPTRRPPLPVSCMQRCDSDNCRKVCKRMCPPTASLDRCRTAGREAGAKVSKEACDITLVSFKLAAGCSVCTPGTRLWSSCWHYKPRPVSSARSRQPLPLPVVLESSRPYYQQCSCRPQLGVQFCPLQSAEVHYSQLSGTRDCFRIRLPTGDFTPWGAARQQC